ncbi:hypothetical protein [Arthrobacter psychrolactophilus]
MHSLLKKTLAMAVVAPAMLLTMAAPPSVAAPGDPAARNVALASAGATVTSSGDETPGRNGTALANDGDPATRWSVQRGKQCPDHPQTRGPHGH